MHSCSRFLYGLPGFRLILRRRFPLRPVRRRGLPGQNCLISGFHRLSRLPGLRRLHGLRSQGCRRRRMGFLCIRFLFYQFLCLWHLKGWLVLATLCLAGCYQSSLRLPGLHRRELPCLRLQLRLPRPAVPISSALNTVCLLGRQMRCSLPGLPAGRILRLRFRLYFRRLAALHYRPPDSPD